MEDASPSWIYVFELADGKFLIGSDYNELGVNNLFARCQQIQFNPKNYVSERDPPIQIDWILQFPVVSIVECFPTPKSETEVVKQLTLSYMVKYGIDNVRSEYSGFETNLSDKDKRKWVRLQLDSSRESGVCIHCGESIEDCSELVDRSFAHYFDLFDTTNQKHCVVQKRIEKELEHLQEIREKIYNAIPLQNSLKYVDKLVLKRSATTKLEIEPSLIDKYDLQNLTLKEFNASVPRCEVDHFTGRDEHMTAMNYYGYRFLDSTRSIVDIKHLDKYCVFFYLLLMKKKLNNSRDGCNFDCDVNMAETVLKIYVARKRLEQDLFKSLNKKHTFIRENDNLIVMLEEINKKILVLCEKLASIL